MRRFDPRVDRWVPLSVDEVGARIGRTSAWLSGGVALDHWLGYPTREHGDTDVSVTAAGWADLVSRLEPGLRAFRAEGGWLSSATTAPSVNTWFADTDGRWRLQVNLEGGDAECWCYRRDERVALPWAQAVLDVGGITTGAPAVQLLWKSRSPSPKDLDDWRVFWPLLPPENRHWLRSAVELAHPESRVLSIIRG